MPETVQWEYFVQSVGSFWRGARDDEFEALLNQLGEQGWEVVALRSIENSNQAQVIAKRPLTASTRRRSSWPG